MALISWRHFVSPFTNKTHLFTMLSIVGLFTVFRIAGGGTEVVTPETPRGENQLTEPAANRLKASPELPAEEQLPVKTSPDLPSETEVVPTSQEASPSIDEILRENTAANPPLADADTTSAVNKAEKETPGGLDEIAKALGMQ